VISHPTTTSATSQSPTNIQTSTSPSSSGGSSSISWSYLGIIAVNAALFLTLGGLVAMRRKNRKG
jgi:LPXTG-motif cell wall-anchored protein